MNRPVPITKGDAARARKPMDSTAVAVRLGNVVIRAASAVAKRVAIKAAGIAMARELASAGQTGDGSERRGGRPRRITEISGANRKKATPKLTPREGASGGYGDED